ncbi:MAG: VRR-NUC domain-containing protein [Oscillospiraceae bacterium]|nr:VRR-NUC domain-containing protein [Oscillospiraceae bacterium]
MRERQIEQKLVKAVCDAGGICPKMLSPGMDGMPDRLVLLRPGRIGFVEVKAPGKTPRPLQTHRHSQLRALGFPVFVLDDPKKIPWILEEVAAWRT